MGAYRCLLNLRRLGFARPHFHLQIYLTFIFGPVESKFIVVLTIANPRFMLSCWNKLYVESKMSSSEVDTGSNVIWPLVEEVGHSPLDLQ